MKEQFVVYNPFNNNNMRLVIRNFVVLYLDYTKGLCTDGIVFVGEALINTEPSYLRIWHASCMFMFIIIMIIIIPNN